MRNNYRMYPTDYVNELQQNRRRMKARCFMEYYHDVQMGEVNSFGFYAQSWGGKEKPMSKGTAYKWIAEFNKEIEKFWGYHTLKNQHHYTSVRNQSERQVNGKRTANPSETPIKSPSEKAQETVSERQVNEAFNIDDDDRAGGEERLRKQLFDDLYRIYRFNTKFAGKKGEGWEAYRHIDDISHKDMIMAIVLYLHDRTVEKRYNLANFLRNEIYLNYIHHRLRVKIADEWIIGDYDNDTEVFTDDQGKTYRLTPTRLGELLGNGDLVFVVGEDAA